MNKKLTALLLIYVFQFIMSCDERCYCPPIKTFEKTFKGFELKAWDTSGFQSKEVTNTVNKNSFGLTVSVQFNFNQISYRQSKFDFSYFGFASAYACSCPMDKYIDVDAIEAIKILVTDTKPKKLVMLQQISRPTITIENQFQSVAFLKRGLRIKLIYNLI